MVVAAFVCVTVGMGVRMRMAMRVPVLVPSGLVMGVGMLVAAVFMLVFVSSRGVRHLPRSCQLPDGNRPDQRHEQNHNASGKDRDKEQFHQDPVQHAGLVHEDRHQADASANQNREQLVEKERTFAFRVIVCV
jgi:hypothetical protein